MINLSNVTKNFKRKTIFQEASLNIPSRGIYALAGRSGTGKTTLLRMIKGLDSDYKGNIEFDGLDISDITYITQSSELIDNITVNDFLMIFSENQNLIQSLLKDFNLNEKYGMKTQLLSGGEKKRLLIIVAILTNKKVILLDEPYSGLDEDNARYIYQKLKSLSDNHLIILSTHQMQEEDLYDGLIKIEKRKLYINNSDNKKLNLKNLNEPAVFYKKRIFKYLRKSSFSWECIIVGIICAFTLISSLLVGTYVSFDESSVLSDILIEDNSLPIVDSWGVDQFLLSHNEKAVLQIDVDTLFDKSLFSYNQELENTSLDFIGFSEFGKEVIVSKDLADELEVKIGDTISTFNENIKISKIESRINGTIILPKYYFAYENITLGDLALPLYYGDVFLGDYSIDIDSFYTHDISFPEELESLVDRVSLRNIYNGREFFNYSFDLNLNYSRRIDNTIENQSIKIGEDILSDFVFDFFSSYSLASSASKKTINYLFKNNYNLITRVDDILTELRNFQDHVKKEAIIITICLSLAVLGFFSYLNILIDKKVFIKEIRFIEMLDHRKDFQRIHISIHLFYDLAILLITTLALLIFKLFANTPILVAVTSMLSSLHSIIIMLSLLILFFVLQSLIIHKASFNNAYKYYNFLSKSKE